MTYTPKQSLPHDTPTCTLAPSRSCSRAAAASSAAYNCSCTACMCRVGQNHMYTVCIRYFWQKSPNIRSCKVYIYGSGQPYACGNGLRLGQQTMDFKELRIRLRPSHQIINSKGVNLLVCCQHGTLPAWHAEKLCKSPQKNLDLTPPKSPNH